MNSSIFGTVRTNMLKKYFLYSFSLSSFMTILSSLSYFFLLSPPVPYLLSLPLPFFFFFLLQNLPALFSFFFFLFSFFFFLFLSAFSIAIEISRCHGVWPHWWGWLVEMHASLVGFFFLVVDSMWLGGGGVGLIPCDLGCINGVDSSLHFLYLF